MEENISLKDKCRNYQEKRNYILDTDKYILAHIDGRSFSKMVKNNFAQPFDNDFIKAMNDTAAYLCKNVQGAKIAYVQSDEISLLIKKDNPEGDIFFGGRLCKMQSVIASLATAYFNKAMIIYNYCKGHDSAANYDPYCDEEPVYTINHICENIDMMPLYQFDCKVWDVDNENDAIAWFLFRNIDCIRNSKQQTAQTYLSHKELMGHNADEQIAMAKDKKGVDWNNFSDGEKYGRFIIKNYEEFHNENGNYFRSVWKARGGFDMTIPENREEFKEIINKRDELPLA